MTAVGGAEVGAGNCVERGPVCMMTRPSHPLSKRYIRRRTIRRNCCLTRGFYRPPSSKRLLRTAEPLSIHGTAERCAYRGLATGSRNWARVNINKHTVVKPVVEAGSPLEI